MLEPIAILMASIESLTSLQALTRPLTEVAEENSPNRADSTWMGAGLAARHSEVCPFLDPHQGPAILKQSQRALETIFKLLYDEEISTDTLRFEDFAEIATYAAMYDLLTVIAPRLRTLLLRMPEVWEDVRTEYLHHLTLARALKCEEIFNDALRHFVGIGHGLSELKDHFDFSAELTLSVAVLQQKQARAVSILTADVQALTLPAYYHPNNWTDAREEPYVARLGRRGQFCSAHKPTAQNYYLSTARHIFSQWLNHQLSGTQPWPFLLDNHMERLEPLKFSSFRNACTLATNAYQTGTELDLFELSAPESFLAAHRDVRHPDEPLQASDPEAIMAVEDELKTLIGQMSSLSLPFVAAPNFQPAVQYQFHPDCTDPHRYLPPISTSSGTHGHGGYVDETTGRSISVYQPSRARRDGEYGTKQQYGEDRSENVRFERFGLTAMNDLGCHYFTCVDLSEQQLPWDGEFDKAYKIRGGEPASKGWLTTLGLLHPNQ